MTITPEAAERIHGLLGLVIENLARTAIDGPLNPMQMVRQRFALDVLDALAVRFRPEESPVISAPIAQRES